MTMLADEWKGTKRQRDVLRQKFGGRCAYCGCTLEKMQADHMEPVTRVATDPWGRKLNAADQRLMRPEYNVASNMMPSCPPCNLHKGGYRLDEWRQILQRAPEIIAREKSIFRAAIRFGVVAIKDDPIVFYFETRAAADKMEGEA